VSNVLSFQSVTNTALLPEVKEAKVLSLVSDEVVQDKLSYRGLVVKSGFGWLFSVSLAAKAGLIKGPGGNAYSDLLIARDLGASVVSSVLGFSFVKTITWLAKKGTLQPQDSRKLIHTFSAPVFMLLWPMFSSNGRWFAACVPFTNAIRLFLAGRGEGETELANAVSRSGGTEEALGGPFVYCLILFASIVLFWTDSLVGVLALCTMAVGDGVADMIGRRFGKNNKWFFSRSKSVVGSLAFWAGATIASIGISMWFSAAGIASLPHPVQTLATRIATITGASALVELIPLGDDNWTVPAAAAAFSMLLLRQGS